MRPLRSPARAAGLALGLALAVSLASADSSALPRGAAAVGVDSWLRWGGCDTEAVLAAATLSLLALALFE
jgi:hypothetical protein